MEGSDHEAGWAMERDPLRRAAGPGVAPSCGGPQRRRKPPRSVTWSIGLSLLGLGTAAVLLGVCLHQPEPTIEDSVRLWLPNRFCRYGTQLGGLAMIVGVLLMGWSAVTWRLCRMGRNLGILAVAGYSVCLLVDGWAPKGTMPVLDSHHTVQWAGDVVGVSTLEVAGAGVLLLVGWLLNRNTVRRRYRPGVDSSGTTWV